jgi:hypothetical protein
MIIADLCRKESIHTTLYYKWSKAFLEAGKTILNLLIWKLRVDCSVF